MFYKLKCHVTMVICCGITLLYAVNMFYSYWLLKQLIWRIPSRIEPGRKDELEIQKISIKEQLYQRSETERKTLFGYFKMMDRWNSIFIIKMRDSFSVLRFISGKFSDGILRNLTNVISSSGLHLRTLYLYFSTNTRMILTSSKGGKTKLCSLLAT